MEKESPRGGPAEPRSEAEQPDDWQIVPLERGALAGPAPTEAGDGVSELVPAERAGSPAAPEAFFRGGVCSRRAAAFFGTPASGYGRTPAPGLAPGGRADVPAALLDRPAPPSGRYSPRREYHVVVRDRLGERLDPAVVGRTWSAIRDFCESHCDARPEPIKRYRLAVFQSFAKEEEAREFARLHGSRWPSELF